MDIRRLVFARVAWMERYKGTNGDKPQNGGSYVDEEQHGHEVYNFMPKTLKGEIVARYYGCFYIGSSNDYARNLDLSNIGAPAGSRVVADVTVVLVATKPDGSGQYIVGFYTKADLYSSIITGEDVEGGEVNYRIVADITNSKLLQSNARKFEIVGLGQSNVWYGGVDKDFKREVLNYVSQWLPKSATKV